MQQLLIAFGVATALVLGAFVWFLGAIVFQDSCGDVERFSPEAWRRAARAHPDQAQRRCMVDDLLARRVLDGRTREEVIALLGEPLPADHFLGADFAYHLGPERSPFGIDSEWLELTLDSLGRVTGARVTRD